MKTVPDEMKRALGARDPQGSDIKVSDRTTNTAGSIAENALTPNRHYQQLLLRVMAQRTKLRIQIGAQETRPVEEQRQGLCGAALRWMFNRKV